MHGLRGHLARYFGSSAIAVGLALCFVASGCGDDAQAVDGAGPEDGGVTDSAPHDGGVTDGASDDGRGDVEVAVRGTVTYDSVPATYDASTGRATLAFSLATVKPVRNAVVQLRQGPQVLASTTTDEQGDYEFSLTAPASGAIEVAVLAKTLSPPIQVENNTDGDAVWEASRPLLDPKGTLDLHATHGWTGTSYDAAKRLAAPFAVLDTLYAATRTVLAVRTVEFPPLAVGWSPENVPQRGDVALGFIDTTRYSSQTGKMYVLGKDRADTDEFDAHVLVQEWTRFVEHRLSRSDSPGGSSGTGDVLDPRVSFSDGLARAFAAMVLSDSIYVDTRWDGTSSSWTGFGIDAETAPSRTDDPEPGAFSQATVHRLLFDLYDSGTNEVYDLVDLGLGPVFDVLVGGHKSTSALTTIASFIAALKSQPGVSAAAVDSLLAHYQIGPITTAWGDGDADLASMYTRLSSLPYSSGITLSGGSPSNVREQNQYFTFTGTGAAVTVSATSSDDVAIAMFHDGKVVGSADDVLTGTEQASVATTQLDATYVVVLTGFRSDSGNYGVNVAITSL